MREASAIGKVALATVLASAGLWVGCGSFGSTADSSDAGSTSTGDGGGETDAQPPAVAASSFCDGAGTPKRCIDFDRPSQILTPFGFDAIFKDNNALPFGTLAIDGTTSQSPPNSLHVETLDGGSAEADMIIEPSGALPATLRVQLRFRYDLFQPGESSSTHFLSLRCRSKSAGQIYLKLSSSQKLGLVQDTATGIDPPSALGFEIAKWHKLEVTFDFASTKTIRLSLNGEMPFGASLPVESFSCTDALVLRFGSWVSVKPGDYGVRFDDIVVDWP